jgi:hypothetical protein
MFESLWVDQSNALERLPKLVGVDACSDEVAGFRSFIQDGYCIIAGAVNVNAIDQYLSDFDQISSLDGGLLASYGAEIKPAQELGRLRPLTKFLDVHAKIPSAAGLAFSTPIKTFLECLLGEEALAFQSLHFEQGSTQALHQDTAYVVVDEPKSLCASWIALEDVEPGAGELVYFPGSHRFPDYLYGDGRKHWNLEDDGGEPHDRHLARLYEQARDRDIELHVFFQRKATPSFGMPILPMEGV